MTDYKAKKDFVIATCRVPVDLHTRVSRKLAGTHDSFQSLMLGALESYITPTRAQADVEGSGEVAELAERFVAWAAKGDKGLAEQGLYEIVRQILMTTE